MDKELRKEIVKKLNRAKKIDLESRKLKDELQNMIGKYFGDYEDYPDEMVDMIYDFAENGEYGGDSLFVVPDGCSGNEFIKMLEKYFKENYTLE